MNVQLCNFAPYNELSKDHDFKVKILHRNRAILLEIMGKSRVQKKIQKLELDQKKFNYSYYTATHVNKHGKRLFQVYDFSYVIFTNQTVAIYRKTNFLKNLESEP